MNASELHEARVRHCGPLDAYTADRLSIKAFRSGQSRLCQRCQERHTVNRGAVCAACLAEVAAEWEAKTKPMPLFGEASQ